LRKTRTVYVLEKYTTKENFKQELHFTPHDIKVVIDRFTLLICISSSVQRNVILVIVVQA
jgi:hypothetical protein